MHAETFGDEWITCKWQKKILTLPDVNVDLDVENLKGKKLQQSNNYCYNNRR